MSIPQVNVYSDKLNEHKKATALEKLQPKVSCRFQPPNISNHHNGSETAIQSINIYSDNQGRGLASIMSHRVNRSKVQGSVKPGAKHDS